MLSGSPSVSADEIMGELEAGHPLPYSELSPADTPVHIDTAYWIPRQREREREQMVVTVNNILQVEAHLSVSHMQ
jgi:hypothetical protein